MNKYNIQKKFIRLSDKELIDIVYENCDLYTDEAIDIAKIIIDERGGIASLKEKIRSDIKTESKDTDEKFSAPNDLTFAEIKSAISKGKSAVYNGAEKLIIGDENNEGLKGAGKFSCPKCSSLNTDCNRDIGCAVCIIIFISLGIGFIMIPFLPYHCECKNCGCKWKP